jgi:hypothetical protein
MARRYVINNPEILSGTLLLVKCAKHGEIVRFWVIKLSTFIQGKSALARNRAVVLVYKYIFLSLSLDSRKRLKQISG